MTARIGFKLLRRRKDGSLGPLFIGKRQRLELGVEYQAEAIRTKGYAFRPGWHVCSTQSAPHLTCGKAAQDRVWARVAIDGVTEHQRPECQGGLWFTAQRMTIIEIIGGAA